MFSFRTKHVEKEVPRTILDIEMERVESVLRAQNQRLEKAATIFQELVSDFRKMNEDK